MWLESTSNDKPCEKERFVLTRCKFAKAPTCTSTKQSSFINAHFHKSSVRVLQWWGPKSSPSLMITWFSCDVAHYSGCALRAARWLVYKPTKGDSHCAVNNYQHSGKFGPVRVTLSRFPRTEQYLKVQPSYSANGLSPSLFSSFTVLIQETFDWAGLIQDILKQSIGIWWDLSLDVGTMIRCWVWCMHDCRAAWLGPRSFRLWDHTTSV